MNGTRAYRRKLAELTVLAVVLAALGLALTPIDVSSIWMDHEFTGWVAPIANRLATGQRLYADGAHSPLPPLPFVLVRLISSGSATWYLESRLNFSCQALAILAMYIGLSRHFRGALPLAATLATIPMFLLPNKGLFYDCLTQFLVAVLSVLGVAHVLPRAADEIHPQSNRNVGSDRRANGRATREVVVIAATTAICILSKQNTGVGVAIGVALLLVVFPRPVPVKGRLRELALYVVGTAGVLLVVCVALSPFIRISGMVVDVFLTGAEPKGGPERLLAYLGNYAHELGGLLRWAPAAIVPLWAAGIFTRDSGACVLEPGRGGPLVRVAALAGAAFAIAVWLRGSFPSRMHLDQVSVWFGNITLSGGLLLLMLVIVVVVVGPRRWIQRNGPEWAPLAAFGMVTFVPAVFHSLSVPSFRWTVDNNPLITVAVAAALFVTWRTCARLVAGARLAALGLTLATALVFLVEVALWGRLLPKLDEIYRCTQAWPEVTFLAGARLGDSASGMRQVVRGVRAFAPNPSDTVLLLPEDPNVEAWFERPRPALTSAIIFTDQYWERYVEEDFSRLENAPPKVMVMGPRKGSRWFQLGWNHGAANLIERVEHELLPKRYHRLASERISVFPWGMDDMDIFVRD